MRHILIFIITLAVTAFFTPAQQIHAQTPQEIHGEVADSTVADGPFRTYIYNKEYKVFIRLNAYEQNITVPGQEIFGEIAGYFKSDDDGRCWLITSVELAEDGKSALLDIINDYGSEDLSALLSVDENGVYTLKQLEGSTIKIARNKKWVKMPKTLIFEKK